ncbi:MAG: 3-alpha,7-alpha,12-alpha-trihydroxy-5-beta-cholest-24-enoyl-CoA hydratase [Alphaproteobacteria bacterium]|nr:3-alpha,7-alpha,12-alpha-trihydroxy-5-beta-cholest-24-enoyl-CoA hydratase [Alphaproteobacteria bacterium]
MAIVYDKLMRWSFPDIEQRLTKRDAILYALGLGLGADPLDEKQLRFVYEDGLLSLPTMAVVLGYPGQWAKDPATGLDWVKILHGEQGIRLHKPLPAEGAVIGKSRITGIVDKGKERGALIHTEREVFDQATGDKLATLTSTTFARGDGGFGGPSGPSKDPHPLPTRKPDLACDLPTLPQAALIYRLSGDYNPLHADPKVARAAGFKAPILHGLCSLGVAGHAILKSCCDYDPARFKSLDLRFSAPVYPGETIRTEMWREGSVISFRSKVVERDVVVLNNGRAEVA